MNRRKLHPGSGSEDLHGERSHTEPLFDLEGHPIDPELRRVDRAVERLARSQSIPTGLAERLYQASVEHLPTPQKIQVDFQQTQRSHRSRSWRSPAFSRLAMAAAVGLAFIVAIWAMTESTPTPLPYQTSMIANTNSGSNIVLFAKPIGPERSPLTRTGKAVFVVSRDDVASPVSQLMETDRMSYSDLIGDMANIVEEASSPSIEADYQQYDISGPDLGI